MNVGLDNFCYEYSKAIKTPSRIHWVVQLDVGCRTWLQNFLYREEQTVADDWNVTRKARLMWWLAKWPMAHPCLSGCDLQIPDPRVLCSFPTYFYPYKPSHSSTKSLWSHHMLTRCSHTIRQGRNRNIANNEAMSSLVGNCMHMWWSDHHLKNLFSIALSCSVSRMLVWYSSDVIRFTLAVAFATPHYSI